MGKLTEAFAMTRRQRQGMTLVLFILAASLAWLWYTGEQREPIGKGELAEMQQFARTTDSLLAAQTEADSLKHAERLHKQRERALGQSGRKDSNNTTSKAPKKNNKHSAASGSSQQWDPNRPVREMPDD